MFLDFFLLLKNQSIPVTLKEYLDLLEGLDKRVIGLNVNEFYILCKVTMIKKEKHLDQFDQLFGAYFKGLEEISEEEFYKIPEAWLQKNKEKFLSPEEMEEIKALGGLDKLIDRVKALMKEQKDRHEGGSKWIGTGGISPFGAYGYNPEGIRIGQNESRHRKAVKVWDKRNFVNLRDDIALDTRNMKMALRKLRVLTREGLAEELDLNATIKKTSDNAGMLDLKMVPKKRNHVKVLLLLDIGGSMDDHIALCSRLFSAAKYEFKNIDSYYFHNCIYENLWMDNTRRESSLVPTYDVLHKYNKDYKVIIVGDASMSIYEIMNKYGSVEHYNLESGITWMSRFKAQFTDMVWLNPTPKNHWRFTDSIGHLQRFMDDRMFPLTLEGIENAVGVL